jgi:hypothetical protein
MERHYKISQEINSKKSKTICERGLIGLSKEGALYIMSPDGERITHSYKNARVAEIAAHVIVFEAFEERKGPNDSVIYNHRRIFCVYTD